MPDILTKKSLLLNSGRLHNFQNSEGNFCELIVSDLNTYLKKTKEIG